MKVDRQPPIIIQEQFLKRINRYDNLFCLKTLNKILFFLRKASYQHKRKHCVIVCATSQWRQFRKSLVVRVASIDATWIHQSTEPTTKCMESMHFVIQIFI